MTKFYPPSLLAVAMSLFENTKFFMDHKDKILGVKLVLSKPKVRSDCHSITFRVGCQIMMEGD